MMKILKILIFTFLLITNANAYIGIGPLLPLLGGAIMYIFVGIIIILGFIFYPLKKIYSYLKNKKNIKSDNNKSLKN
ncbi:hypothetical protein [Candidatus Pelagibacter communis]|uniref:hypothetical protein n=1 Tax=Pelagibacter ubique TaxID=198252 RepID=UPI00094C9F2C|nr:hypothetical protein [Candidatus Pelagibacter ubique]